MSKDKILVIDRIKLDELVKPFQGFLACDDMLPKRLCMQGKLYFAEREPAEQNPAQKQLIPYCVFYLKADPTRIYVYRRTPKGGEPRLHGKRSIGVGGHIDEGNGTTWTSYKRSLWREIVEEVALQPAAETTATGPMDGQEIPVPVIGLLNDDSTPAGTPEGKIPVGQVHLGIVHAIGASDKLQRRCADLADDGFYTVAELLKDRDSFETWSQLVLDYLSTAGMDVATLANAPVPAAAGH